MSECRQIYKNAKKISGLRSILNQSIQWHMGYHEDFIYYIRISEEEDENSKIII